MRSPALRHVITHLITPLLMCIGMGLAYMGAFVTPEPHHLPVAVVGSGPQAKVFAQTVKDKAGDRLDVRTVATRSEAVELSPQNAYIRRLQHQMAERANLVSRSRGREPYRRVRLYPDAARSAWR